MINRGRESETMGSSITKICKNTSPLPCECANGKRQSKMKWEIQTQNLFIIKMNNVLSLPCFPLTTFQRQGKVGQKKWTLENYVNWGIKYMEGGGEDQEKGEPEQK